MQISLHCYTTESRYDWVSRLPMFEFYDNCSINEASEHSPIEVSYGFWPTTHAYKLLPLTGAPAHAGDRLTELASDRDVVRELLTLSKQRMVARSSRQHLFLPLVILCSYLRSVQISTLKSTET